MRQNDPSVTTMPPARGTKTLAWFMDQTNIFEKQQEQMMRDVTMERRMSSSDESKSISVSSSSASIQQAQQSQPQQQQQKKQKRYRKTLSQQGAARKDGYTASQAMSESSEDGSVQSAPRAVQLPQQTTSSTTTNGEEYWFYDVATDGYYYEQNGAKGWRRRQPNTAVYKAGGKDQEVAHMNVNGPSKYNQLLAAQAHAAAQAAFLQQAFQFQQAMSSSPSGANPKLAPQQPQQPQQQQPTMRYYDPNSDGFFYEMASVDGWKRRQPNKPVSASVPAGITRPYSQRQADQMQQQVQGAPSYGAALARGQFPRNTVKQQNSTGGSDVLSAITTPAPDSSSNSSQCGDTFAELFANSDPLFNPVQRPSALNLEQKAVSPQLENAPTSTAALFEAVLADFGRNTTSSTVHNILPTPSSQSPMKESWNSFRSCSLFSPIKPSKRVLAPSTAPMGTPMIDELDDDTMKMLMRDLDKLWANTPVSGLNQA